MKQWFYKVFTLTVVGMVVYLIFSKDDSLYYHFPWELFAGIGIMSWAVQELEQKYQRKGDPRRSFFCG